MEKQCSKSGDLKLVNKKKSKSKNLNIQILIGTLASVLVNGITFISAPIFSRMLGVDDYGIVTVYEAWIKIISIVCGIQTCASIGTARVHFPEKDFNNYVTSALTLSMCSSVGFIALAAIFGKLLENIFGLDYILIIILFINSAASYFVNFQSMVFIQQKKVLSNGLLSLGLISSTICLSMIFIHVFPTNHYLGRVFGLLFPNIILSIYIIIHTLRSSKQWYNRIFWKYALMLGGPIVFHNLSTVILAQTDKIMLQKSAEAYTAVGLYGLVVSFVHVLSILYTSINNVWVPFYYDDMKNGNFTAILCKTGNYLKMGTVLFAGFIFLAPEVFRLYSSEEYWTMIPLIPIIAASSYLMLLYTFAVNYEFYMKQTKLIAMGSCIAALCNFILNSFLIPLFGITGAAVATCISYVLLFIFHQFMAVTISKKNKEYPYHLKWAYIVKPFLLMLVIIVISYCLQNYMFIRWGLAGCIGVCWVMDLYRRKSIF